MLVHHIYPALAAAEAAAGPAGAGTYEQPGSRPPGLQRQQQPEQAAPAAGESPRRVGGGGWRGGDEEEAAEDAWLVGPSTQLDSPTVAAALQQPAFRRWPEAAGALVLYFTAARPAGAPAGDAQLDTLATLRRLPPPLLRAAEVRAALRLRAALAAGDYVALFRLREGAPPLVRALLSGSVAAAARERALVVLASAYRNIAVAAVCRTLALDTPRLLLACLKLLADRWVLQEVGAADLVHTYSTCTRLKGSIRWLAHSLICLLNAVQGPCRSGPCTQWAAAGGGGSPASGGCRVQGVIDRVLAVNV